MRKFLKNIILSYKIMKVHSLYEKSRFQKAIDVLNKIDEQYSGFENALPDYYILFGQLYYEIGKLEDAAEKFIDALNAIENSTALNGDEKNYLTLYVLQWLDFLYQKNVKFGKKVKICDKKKCDYTEFSIDNVRHSLVDYFPVDFERKINLKQLIK